MPQREALFQMRITNREKELISRLAVAEDRTMSRAVMTAVKHFAREKYDMEVAHEEDA